VEANDTWPYTGLANEGLSRWHYGSDGHIARPKNDQGQAVWAPRRSGAGDNF